MYIIIDPPPPSSRQPIDHLHKLIISGGEEDGRFNGFLFIISVGQGADGSAYLEMGQTKVIAIVNGPREVTRRYYNTLE